MAANNKPIKATELRLTKIAGMVTAVLAPSGAVAAAFIETLAEQPTPAFFGILGIVAVLLVAFALIASADILGRAWVVAAKERSGSSDQNGSPVPMQEIIQTRFLSATGIPFAVQVNRLSSEPVQVLALRWDEKTSKGEYLVGESGAGLVWIAEDEAQGLTFPA